MPHTISLKLDERARTHGDAPAIVFDELELTWREVRSLSLKISSFLRARGVKKGDHVGIICGNRPCYITAWFAIANLGAVTVTINTKLIGASLRYAIEQSSSKFLLVEEELLESISEDIAPISDGFELIPFKDDRAMFDMVADEAEDEVYDGRGSDPLIIGYTSGTTGFPKGVVNCHQAYLESASRLCDNLEITDADRILVMLPLFHANPQVYVVMTALQSGCTIVLRPKFSVSRLFEDARRFRATMTTYVGTILAMLDNGLPDGDRDHAITRCIGGGCSVELWHRIMDKFGMEVHEVYGMSETAGWVSIDRLGDVKVGSCGQIRDDMELVIVDEDDNPKPAGELGEIILRPKQPNRILVGYWNKPEETVKASANFWFHTGDMGCVDDDGYVYFRGRFKEIIRRGGENISPAELDTLIMDFPKIEDLATVAVPDEIMGDEIKVCVVASEPFTIEELREYLAPRVPGFMMPRYLQFVDEIPRTETEKIKRTVLQQDDTGVIDAFAEKGAA